MGHLQRALKLQTSTEFTRDFSYFLDVEYDQDQSTLVPLKSWL